MREGVRNDPVGGGGVSWRGYGTMREGVRSELEGVRSDLEGVGLEEIDQPIDRVAIPGEWFGIHLRRNAVNLVGAGCHA